MMVFTPKIPWTQSLIIASVGGLSLLILMQSQVLLSHVFGPTINGFIQKEEMVHHEMSNNGSEVVNEPFSAPIVLPSDGKEQMVSGGDSRKFDSVAQDGNLVLLNSSIFGVTNKSVDADLGTCDLYRGKWVYDLAGPLYTNNSCPVLTQSQNCQGNGRPDKDYENWKWKPKQCVLPRFNAAKFMEMMRGKTLAFVGDSIARNQMESLLCMLWQVETPQNRGSRRMHRWIFRSTSVTIVRIWSSWLVHKTAEPLQNSPSGVVKVHLDTPDEALMEFLPKVDIVVLSTGHWFDKQTVYVLNGTIVNGRQRKQPKKARKMNVDNVKALGMSVETALTSIATHPNYRGLTVLRTYTPDHYEGGSWNSGGSCSGITSPSNNIVRNGYTELMHNKQVEAFKVAASKLSNGSKMKLMDITEVSGYRHDGHPGPYRSPNWQEETRKKGHNRPPQDCLHWCMPGPVDTWNQILFELIRREFEERRNQS